MYKVDLHTHSVASPDGGVTAEQYRATLANGTLDSIAITDHNSIDFATRLKQELGDQIIIGEEIMTQQGEVIGLYLTELVPAGLDVQETITRIRAQNGIVYIPHPFETVRKGLHPAVMDDISKDIDIVEICNGRAFLQDKSEQTVVWTRLNNIVGAASSDAHGVKGLGKTYTAVSEPPTRNNLVKLLTTATCQTEKPSLRALLYPKYHRLRKKVGRSRA